MQTLKKFYFGKQKAKVNTYIGGIGGTINTPALLASRLGIAENRIKLFKVTGVDVECAVIGGSYHIPSNAFQDNTFIKFYNDPTNIVSSIGSNAFKNCTSLTSIQIKLSGVLNASVFENTRLVTIDLTDVTMIMGNVFAYVSTLTGHLIANNCTSVANGAFYNTKIQSFTAIECINIGNVAFFGCSQCTTYNLPELLILGDSSVFQGNINVVSVYIPKVNRIGLSNTIYNQIFKDIKTNCSITVPLAMSTINAGGVEPDISYAITSRAAIITYV